MLNLVKEKIGILIYHKDIFKIYKGIYTKNAKNQNKNQLKENNMANEKETFNQ